MDTAIAMPKRRSYTIKEKLAIIGENEEGVTGSGFHALGIKLGVEPGTEVGDAAPSTVKWKSDYTPGFSTETSKTDGREQLCPAAPEWYIPYDERASLFTCLIHGLGAARDDFIADLCDYMASLDDLGSLVNATYLDSIRNGDTDPGELELYSASKLHNWNIKVKTVNTDGKVVSTFVYTVEIPEKIVEVVRSGSFFVVKVDGYLV
ncbi:hypothetical protein PF008_g8424 [Phytophthora fragariae]|uniref:Uncharacterized protein n=1 Tax=Phytophthora fragariae TaxID=53985 RepID=A0A6G0RZK4_9STRA|nr:hypothetical protein PF008_g8424 [Phytophthora fragariae]